MSTTKGYLDALIESLPAKPNFKTTNVKFMGSNSDPDCLLLGTESSDRTLMVYIQDKSIPSGVHPLPAEGLNAHWVERGIGTWDSTEGWIKILWDLLNDSVKIEFEFNAVLGSDDSTEIKVQGSGRFEGRVPWSAAARNSIKLLQTTT